MPQAGDEEEGGNGNTYSPFHIPIHPRPVMADQYALIPPIQPEVYMKIHFTLQPVLIGGEGILDPQSSGSLLS
jgi:hypothetical protein